MNISELRTLCRSLRGVAESMPFTRLADVRSREIVCPSVGGKWFCLYNPLAPDFCNLKCDPAKVQTLPLQYEGIRPGWHMNKKHWISIYFHSDVPDDLFRDLVREGYEIVLSSLPKKKQAAIRSLPDPALSPEASDIPDAPLEWVPPHAGAARPDPS